MKDLIERLRSVAVTPCQEAANAEDLIHIQAGLRAALAQQTEQGWKPIETAPKDGTIVLLHGGRITTAGSYQPADKNHPWVFLDDAEPDRVNHW